MSDLIPKLPPWKSLSPKQRDLMKIARWKTGHKKLVGVFGTRVSGKTVGCLNVIADHLWRIKDARFLVMVRTQGSGTTSGVWNELTEKVLPAWMEADGIAKEYPELHMAWAEKGKPRANVSKKMVCAVTNMHGGKSKLELDSLDDEREVEEKFKNRYYTGILFCEAGEFKKRTTLTTLYMALRGQGYAEDDFIMLVDANPPDEGEDHFLHEYFYDLRLKSDPTAEEKAIQDCLVTTEWTMADNPFLSDGEKNAIKGLYSSDPDLYDRYVRGLWKRATRDAIFSDIFKPSRHVAGTKEDQMILLPTENCAELFTSHDPGFKNPVLYVIEQVDFQVTFRTREGREDVKTLSKFLFLDELAYINQEKQVSEFTHEVLDKMEKWEQELGHEVPWYHYSDRAALDQKESISNRTVADEMYAESDGVIRLIGVEKKGSSVVAGVRLWRKLLAEQRILISYANCPKLIEANQCLAWKKINNVVMVGKMPDRSPFKHPWDAARYGVEKRCWNELQTMTRQVRMRQQERESTLVTVSL